MHFEEFLEFVVFRVRTTKKKFLVWFHLSLRNFWIPGGFGILWPSWNNFLKLGTQYSCFPVGKFKLLLDKLMKQKKKDACTRYWTLEIMAALSELFSHRFWDYCETEIIRIHHLYQRQLLQMTISVSSLCSNSSF